MKLIDAELIERLYSDAIASNRLRTHYLLHESYIEKVQRLLIAMVNGSYVEPHFHSDPHQWEMFTVIHGRVKVCLYNSSGMVVRELIIDGENVVPVIEFSAGDIHSVECISKRALLLEVKEGPFDPDNPKVMAAFN